MRRLALLIVLLLTVAPGMASANVVVGFYSHKMSFWFPHAFFTLKGKLARGGAIDTNFGFTPKSIDSAIVNGSVDGRLDIATSDYVAKSKRHFEVVIDDATYDRLVAFAKEWGARPKNYNLNKSNCVHFVGYAAQIVGMSVNFDKNIKRPQAFLDALTANNKAWFAANSARARVVAAQ
jgi:hypothetical protein